MPNGSSMVVLSLESFQDGVDPTGPAPAQVKPLSAAVAGNATDLEDLARDVDIPGDWGLEIGIMAEMYRNVQSKRICQTDLGFYDHKHQKMGTDNTGLTKMSQDILKTLLRVLIEEDHINITYMI